VAVAGGVAANSGLRAAMTEACEAGALRLSLPPFSLCTDNAGMIGLAAGFLPALAWPDYLGLDAFASDSEAKAARPPRKRPRPA
jgi:N6-L-threonylcarbamoyladenine synthase